MTDINKIGYALSEEDFKNPKILRASMNRIFKVDGTCVVCQDHGVLHLILLLTSIGCRCSRRSNYFRGELCLPNIV